MAMISFFALIFFHLTTDLCADINVALGKPAWQSSVAPDAIFATAKKAVDGDEDSQINMDDNSCIHTVHQGNPKTAWWQVDLLIPYKTINVEIIYRNYEGGRERLAGFSIFVSNISTGWLHRPSERCFHWTNDSLPSAKASYSCNAFGRFITIYNERNSSPPSGYSPHAVLELCEVKIPVPGNCHNCKSHCSDNKCAICDIGYYGENCELYCGRYCNDGISCNKSTGECSDGRCREGFYQQGTLCIPCWNRCSKCVDYKDCQDCYGQWKGHDRFTKCNQCEINNSCRHNNVLCHICPSSCDSSGCTFNDDLASCTRCGNYTYDHDCKPCPKGCSKCQGPDAYCTACLDGYHGTQCTMSCPVGCNNSSSNNGCTRFENGTVKCNYGCKALHYGLDCKPCGENCLACSSTDGTCSPCKNGFYGSECNFVCPSLCGGNKSCSYTGGRVVCNEGCADRYYGDKCSEMCPSTCGGANRACEQLSGKCKECPVKMYGDDCTDHCSKNCAFDGSCYINNGTCKHSCTQGYIGHDCNARGCANPKMWGPTFNFTCPYTCNAEGHCDAESARCLDGCVPGYFGSNCSTHCYRNCAGEKRDCRRESGQCLYGCKEGWAEPNCSTAEKKSVTGVAVGGAFAGCIIIAVVCIILVVIRRRRLLSIKRKSLYESVTFDAAGKQENNYDQINRASAPCYVQKDAIMPVEKLKVVKTKEMTALKQGPRKTRKVTYYNSDNNEYYNTVCTAERTQSDDLISSVAKPTDNQMQNNEYDEIKDWQRKQPTSICPRNMYGLQLR